MSFSKGVIAASLLAFCLVGSPRIRATTKDEDARQIVARGIPHAEAYIAKLATTVANSKAFFQEDYGQITITARYDTERGMLFLDPGERFGPIADRFEVEDFREFIFFSVEPVILSLPNYSRTEWLFGGRDFDSWFPQESKTSQSANIRRMSMVEAPSHVLVSAGHGYYFNHGFNDWRPQREVDNGILEDEITIPLSDLLTVELMLSGSNVTGARNAALKFHEPSKQPYHMIAARYQLEELLPDHPEIWHSKPDATDALREYHEDILSRPLYANYLGASEAIHLHTNAGIPSARGARVIVQKGRPQDVRLGKMVLCYMKEHIQNIPVYADFYVPSDPHEDNKGENRVANMPSVIVEVAFHTNGQDAEALNDLRFQAAAMKGVAKGYRLYKQGDDCAEFAISAPDKSEGVAGSSVSFPVAFEGNPDFPVVIEVKEDCTGPYCYRNSDIFYDDQSFAGYTHSYSCRKDPAYRPEAVLAIKARDFKGVETKEILHKVTCAPPPALM